MIRTEVVFKEGISMPTKTPWYQQNKQFQPSSPSWTFYHILTLLPPSACKANSLDVICTSCSFFHLPENPGKSSSTIYKPTKPHSFFASLKCYANVWICETIWCNPVTIYAVDSYSYKDLLHWRSLFLLMPIRMCSRVLVNKDILQMSKLHSCCKELVI